MLNYLLLPERIKKIKKQAVNVLLSSEELANKRITNSSYGIQLFSSVCGILDMSPRYDEAKPQRHGNMIFQLDHKRKVRNID